MVARFFVDENDLALGKRLAQLHPDAVVYPGRSALPAVPRGSVDDVWLPIIGAERLVVITRDGRIRSRPAERQAWVQHRVRGFVLTGKKSQSTAASLAILQRHWSQIEQFIAEHNEGPWISTIAARIAGICRRSSTAVCGR